jgi:predicted porin
MSERLAELRRQLIRNLDEVPLERFVRAPLYDTRSGSVSAGTAARKLGAGYELPLSKRTNLYADIGHGREDGKTNNTAYGFGIKHLF